MKHISALILAFILAVSLVACGGGDAEAETTTAETTTPEPTSESTTATTAETTIVCEASGHSWRDATCSIPKTCNECKLTEGEPLGHSWVEATCVLPKTCSRCHKTEGTELGHDTPNLTCVNDDICTRCGETIAAPGHTFSQPTCTEPAICETCGEFGSDAYGHTTDNGVCDRCGLESYVTVSGHGDDVHTDISVGDGIYRVHFTHDGNRNFIVESYDATNDWELLVNDIGNYDGYVLLAGESPYALEISADGDWTYTIERLDEISDTSFAGKGDYVTGLCSLSSGAWEFTHDGSSNFIVEIYTTDGWDLVVNEIGAYDGKKMVTIPTGSLAFFEITADGNWTIKKN